LKAEILAGNVKIKKSMLFLFGAHYRRQQTTHQKQLKNSLHNAPLIRSCGQLPTETADALSVFQNLD
jgi:hypothetical protein